MARKTITSTKDFQGVALGDLLDIGERVELVVPSPNKPMEGRVHTIRQSGDYMEACQYMKPGNAIGASSAGIPEPLKYTGYSTSLKGFDSLKKTLDDAIAKIATE